MRENQRRMYFFFEGRPACVAEATTSAWRRPGSCRGQITRLGDTGSGRSCACGNTARVNLRSRDRITEPLAQVLPLGDEPNSFECHQTFGAGIQPLCCQCAMSL